LDETNAVGFADDNTDLSFSRCVCDTCGTFKHAFFCTI